MPLEDIHVRSLAKSTALASYSVKTAIPPLEVVSALNPAEITFTLVGVHAFGGWMREPRTIPYVDLVVASRHHKKAIRSLLVAFPHLEASDGPTVTQLHDRETRRTVVRLFKPNGPPFRQALRHTHVISCAGQTFKIPTVEMAAVLNFAPMVDWPWSNPDKYQVAHDFIRIVNCNVDIDLRKLCKLAQLVKPGYGELILELTRRVRSGEKLNLHEVPVGGHAANN